MKKQEILICHDWHTNLNEAIQKCPHDKLFILMDEHTQQLCMPILQGVDAVKKGKTITIGAGDENKTVETLSYVWNELSNYGATRHSLLINLGGGMVTDLGGFAAATFKRGMNYINIPTTLLAMVDAAVGGKTGINFNGLKNEVGVFCPAESVLIYGEFLRTLDSDNLFSGYAEMIKHGLISTPKHWSSLLAFDFDHIQYATLQEIIAESVQIKEEIVKQDPYEQGIRKALNLGHTVGHAFESLAMKLRKPVLHGYAVAWGLVCELYLSHRKSGFPIEKLRQTIQFIKSNYGIFTFDCNQYDELYEFMTHDKKNQGGSVNFTLLGDVGDIKINQTATKEEILEMLDFYRETMGC
ncbi:MAG: 3-dehydroquinate synthase [Phocaeicola sp.]